MKKGGKRPGSGRPKGVKNKATVYEERLKSDGGLMPLDYMLSVMRDPSIPRNERIDAAKAAAKYVHPAKQAIEHSGPDGGPISTRNEYTVQQRAVALGNLIAEVRLRKEREQKTGAADADPDPSA